MEYLLNKDIVIQTLQLEKLVDPDGGYYRRTYNSPYTVSITRPDGSTVQRKTMTSIYFMLTNDRKIGYLHKNECDVMLYYQLGLPMKFILLHPDGKLEESVLGPDILSGENVQLFAPGGVWIGSVLATGGPRGCDFGLSSEAASPGFEYCDMTMGTEELVQSLYPQHWDTVKLFIPPKK